MHKEKVNVNFAAVSARGGVKDYKDRKIIVIKKGSSVSLASINGHIMSVPNAIFERH